MTTFAHDTSARFPANALPRKIGYFKVDVASVGIMRPDGLFVSAAILNDDGSGGPTGIAIYGVRDNKPVLLSRLTTGTNTRDVSITNGRLHVTVAWYDPLLHSAHCCPNGQEQDTYELRGGALVRDPATPITIVRNAPTSPRLARGDRYTWHSATTPPLPPGASYNASAPSGAAAAAPIARKPSEGYGADCNSESIETVSENGAFIEILGGHHYIIDAVDRVDTSLWLATDDVVVCEDGTEVKLIHDEEIAHGHLAE